MKRSLAIPVLMSLALLLSQAPLAVGAAGGGSPQFRAIAGVSMGGYGAANIGLSHPELFKTVACLGGPLDMAYMLKYMEVDLIGNYDHSPAYPDRETRIEMLLDLAISFGNPAYYNPLSLYYPPQISRDNARSPTTVFDFFDDRYNPTGALPVITFEDKSPGSWVEILMALDVNGNGKRDQGEPVLSRFGEPYGDSNGNGMWDLEEPFSDVGLDGVPATGDYGESDGTFTFNPSRLNFMSQDPSMRVRDLPVEILQDLNVYVDAGKEDEFQFNIHAERFVRIFLEKGLDVRTENGFPEDFPSVSHFGEKRVFVRYNGGHIGFNKENIGLSFSKARRGAKEAILVANRFTTLFAFVSDHFPGGQYGTNVYEMFRYPSKMSIAAFKSPSLNRKMKYGIYLPPGYKRDDGDRYPVLYLLGGYNMSIKSMANSRMKAALDVLVSSQEMQKMIIVIPDGTNYKNGRGNFFVNQVDQERGARFMDSFFDLTTHVESRFRTK